MKRVPLEPKALWPRYLVALGLLAASLCVSHTAGLMALSGGEEASTTINVSGRQRMLSQRILKLTLREQELAEADPVLSGALDRSIELFVRSHEALTQGGAMGLTEAGAQKRAPVYETGPVTLNERVSRYIADLELARGPDSPARTEALARLEDLRGTDQLLEALDNAVQTFEQQSAEGVVRFRQISWLALGCAFLVLFLEAGFIFWPAQRAVTESFAALKQQRNSLAKSEAELIAALASSDKARQSLNRVLSARTAFLDQISKELHVPASSLRGYVDQLMTEDVPQHLVRHLALVQRAAERMDITIRDGLDLHRIEEGLMIIEEKPLRVDTFVTDVLARYSGRAARKELRLEADIGKDMPPQILGDPTRLDQVLDNLISNAVKFTVKGHITICVRRVSPDEWMLKVADSGEGMSAERLKTIFTRTEADMAEYVGQESGSGLGLPLCKDLAKLMGGNLTAESTPGKGSTFTLTLPLQLASDPGSGDHPSDRSQAA